MAFHELKIDWTLSGWMLGGCCLDDLAPLVDIIEALKSAKFSRQRIQFKVTA